MAPPPHDLTFAVDGAFREWRQPMGRGRWTGRGQARCGRLAAVLGIGSSRVEARIAAARDEQGRRLCEGGLLTWGRTLSGRLVSSVEIVRVRGPDAKHLADVRLEAIREVLAWALSLRSEQEHEHEEGTGRRDHRRAAASARG